MAREEMIEESYENYKSTTLESDMKKSAWELTVQSMSGKKFIMSQEEFINKCKTDTEFSEKWELKIEERELSLEERNKWSWDNWGITCEMESVLDEQEVPTRLITVTYNGETLASYE